MNRVAVLSAHPDDAETNAGGTIARLVAEGSQVKVYVSTVPSDWTERSRQSIDAVFSLGADVYFFHFDPYGFTADFATVQIVEQAIGEFDPDHIISHRVNDSHQDHRTCGLIARSLVRRNRIGLWEMDHSIPGGLIGAEAPTYFVDISDYQRQKMQAVGIHTIQDGWHDTVIARDRYYGGMVGVDYAEGFTVVKGMH